MKFSEQRDVLLATNCSVSVLIRIKIRASLDKPVPECQTIRDFSAAGNDGGGGGANWKLESNHHHQNNNTQFLRIRCPCCCPTNSVKAILATKLLMCNVYS